jgi:hypothetical protein
MQIYDFKINSKIVRVKPSKRIGDRSYIGEKFIFKGIANGMIYLKTTDSYRIKIFNRDSVELQLDDFYDDWEYYIDPLKLERKEKLKNLNYISDNFFISDDEKDQFIKILQVGSIELEKTEKINTSLKNKLKNWIKFNKK